MNDFNVPMIDIHDVSALHGIDMNLLVAFDTLVRERSVTRAAQRAGVSQSAMSHTLRRLRALFEDPLLVRGRDGMVLTPRAEALVGPLRGGLVRLSRALHEPLTFDPSSLRRTFRVVSPDLFDALALPPLLRRLGAEAPGVELAMVPSAERLPLRLETGEIDLAIVPVLLNRDSFEVGFETTPDLRQRTLFQDTFRCFVRCDHPVIGTRRRLSLRAFAELGHILISPRGEGSGVVDRALAEVGVRRRIAVRVPQFGTALAILHESDLVLTAPSSLANVPGAPDLHSLAPPIPVPAHAVTMVWHPRFGEDAAHQWLRELVVDATRHIDPKKAPPRTSRPPDA